MERQNAILTLMFEKAPRFMN